MNLALHPSINDLLGRRDFEVWRRHVRDAQDSAWSERGSAPEAAEDGCFPVPIKHTEWSRGSK